MLKLEIIKFCHRHNKTLLDCYRHRAVDFTTMATIRLYLDQKKATKTNQYSLKWAFCHKTKTSYSPTGITLSEKQWNAEKCRVSNHPDASLINAMLSERKARMELCLCQWDQSGLLQNTDSAQIRDELSGMIPKISVGISGYAVTDPVSAYGFNSHTVKPKVNFSLWFDRFKNLKTNRTAECYEHTSRRLCAYMGSRYSTLCFEDMTPSWLMGFDSFLAQTGSSVNTRAIHMRNIRSVFNFVIGEELITCYPFRKFKIKTVETRKRSLTVEQLRELLDYPCDSYTGYYREIFKLIFCLIGINIVDLCALMEIRDGRIEYVRSKTKRHYSIKVEPEALAIITSLRGKKHLIDIADRYKNYRDITQHINDALQSIGKTTRKGLGGKKTIKPLFPELTSYWARHTWATIAASLDITKETIAAALGHGRKTVTDIYIDFDQRKIDEANRRVLDWVFYSKK